MGFADRDYNREDEYREGFMADTPTCKKIIIATVVVFLLQIFFTRQATEQDYAHVLDKIEERANDRPSPTVTVPYAAEDQPDLDAVRAEELAYLMYSRPEISVIQEWFELDTDKVLHGQVWRLLTTALLHNRYGVTHILFNMLGFYWFGRSLESQYGSREFMLFYIVAAVLASLAFVGIQLATGDRVPGIGASGAVMAVICLFTIWNPGYTIRIYFLFPIQMRFLLAMYVIFDLHPLLLQLSGTAPNTGVAHAAHLGGLAFGYLYWRYGWELEPTYNKVASRFQGATNKGRGRLRSSNTSRPQRQPSPAKQSAQTKLDDRVDAILAKISIEGEQSLSDSERKVLEDASKQYRKRS